MNQITKLQTTIEECEDNAAKLNHDDAIVTEASDVDTAMYYYKDLYELLSAAYFASKDINALLQASLPLVEDNSSDDALRDAQGRIAVLETSLEVAVTAEEEATQQCKILETKVQTALDVLG